MFLPFTTTRMLNAILITALAATNWMTLGISLSQVVTNQWIFLFEGKLSGNAFDLERSPVINDAVVFVPVIFNTKGWHEPSKPADDNKLL